MDSLRAERPPQRPSTLKLAPDDQRSLSCGEEETFLDRDMAIIELRNGVNNRANSTDEASLLSFASESFNSSVDASQPFPTLPNPTHPISTRSQPISTIPNPTQPISTLSQPIPKSTSKLSEEMLPLNNLANIKTPTATESLPKLKRKCIKATKEPLSMSYEAVRKRAYR